MKLFRNSFLSSVIFTMLLATAVVCTVKLTDVGAQKKADSNRYKYYTSVEVKPGDTLTSIAEEYITPEVVIRFTLGNIYQLCIIQMK